MARNDLPSYDFGDVLRHAQTNGTPWNAAHALFEDDKIVPMYDAPYTDIYLSDATHPASAYGWSPEVCKILIDFMTTEKLKAFRMQS